jgi:NAD(P)-dependent dehydrogenase (short-subunit alcohol dehydrogenase family)
VLTDIDDARGQELVAGIRPAGNEALYLSLDVTGETRWQEIVVEFERRYGRLDILVANAGIGIMCTSIREIILADWRRQIAVNLDGVFCR